MNPQQETVVHDLETLQDLQVHRRSTWARAKLGSSITCLYCPGWVGLFFGCVSLLLVYTAHVTIGPGGVNLLCREPTQRYSVECLLSLMTSNVAIVKVRIFFFSLQTHFVKLGQTILCLCALLSFSTWFQASILYCMITSSLGHSKMWSHVVFKNEYFGFLPMLPNF